MATVIIGCWDDVVSPLTQGSWLSAGDRKAVHKFTPVRTGKVERIKFRPFNSDAGALVKGVVYSDNAGSPDALLGTSDELVGFTEETWNTCTFSTAPGITGGTAYWVGLISDSRIDLNTRISGTSPRASNADTYAGGAADPFGTPTADTVTQRAIRAEDDVNSLDVGKLYGYGVLGGPSSEQEVSKLYGAAALGRLDSEHTVSKLYGYAVLQERQLDVAKLWGYAVLQSPKRPQSVWING